MFKGLEYDPHTGQFWKIRGTTRKPVGSRRGDGYIVVKWRGKNHRAHRLAWRIIHGQWPPKNLYIDHINRDRSDNRLENLRLATPTMNAHNNCGRGWGWHSSHRRYQAYIRCGGRLHHLGYWDTADQARQAYLRAKAIYHPTVLQCPTV